MEFVVPSVRVSAEKLPFDLWVKPMTRYLMQMEEDRMVSAYIDQIMQRRRQALVAMNVKFKVFKVWDWAMVYNSKLGPFPGKLTLRYTGPYQIVQDLGQGTFIMANVFGTRVEKPVNGFWLKKFQGKPPHLDWPQFLVSDNAFFEVVIPAVQQVTLDDQLLSISGKLDFDNMVQMSIQVCQMRSVSDEECVRCAN